MPTLKVIRVLLGLTAGISALILSLRAFWGPFHLGMSINSPMNAEMIFSAAILLLVFLNIRILQQNIAESLTQFPLRNYWLLIFLCLLILISHRTSLKVEFVADDYAHILAVSKAEFSYFPDLFTVPAADRFFRPFGMLSYWIDVQWAGFSPFKWHLSAVLLHILNSVLVYFLCRAFYLAPVWSFFSAAFFGLHGSRPETVTWISARFDLTATLFTLLTIILFVHQVRSPVRWRILLMIGTILCGLLSKESAYVLPLLLGTLLWWKSEFRTRTGYKLTLLCSLLTLGTFTYRWFLLSGIGGYVNQQGSPTIFSTSLWLILKALALRLWAVLIFPINWTDSLEPILQICLLLMTACLLALAFRTKADSNSRLFLLLTLISALPVYHLLLIGPDLEKSRVIYLCSAFFAMFLGNALCRTPFPKPWLIGIFLLSFHYFALQHNLETWRRVGEIHARACDALAHEAQTTPVIALEMPNTLDGVYMLKTGISECVEVRHGIPATLVLNLPDFSQLKKADQNFPVFKWNSESKSIHRDR